MKELHGFYIQNIVNKCKRIINTMRCLVGSE